MSYTQQLSDFLAGLRYGDIPEEVITQVKRLTIHVLGVSIAARPIAQTGKAIALAEDKGGRPEASVWGGSGKKVPAEDAAFANATMADILDWEDCSWTGHPSAGAIPAAFAVAEALQSGGKDYITAVTTAYEGYQRIAMAVQPTPAYQAQTGWGLTSWQIFSASLAAAKLYGLDAGQFNQTIGASVYASPVTSNKHSAGNAKSDIYHFAHGVNAQNGILSAKLAREGFGNGYDYLDGDNGYWRQVSDQTDETWYTKGLGERWLINETYIKHWPANMWIQTPLEILDAIYKETPFAASDVEKIRLAPDTNLTSSPYAASGKTTLDAQFNASFCLAAYILVPTPGAHWFTDDRLAHPDVLSLAAKFEAFGEKTSPAGNFGVFKTGSFPEMTVEIHLKGGRVLFKTMSYPKGHPRNQTTLLEEYDLFRAITKPYLSREAAEAVITGIDNLQNLRSLSEIAQYLSINAEEA